MKTPVCERPGGKFCEIKPIPLAKINFTWDGIAKGRKAASLPAANLIAVERSLWDGLREIEGREAILAHERAHLEGARCEPCADYRAGQICRAEGVPSSRDGRRAMITTLENRDPWKAEANFARGFGFDSNAQTFGLDDPKTVIGQTGDRKITIKVVDLGNGMLVRADLAQGLRELLADSADEHPVVISAFRENAKQTDLWNQYQAAEKLRAQGIEVPGAPTLAAKPGSSKHERAEAVDIRFPSPVNRDRFAAKARSKGWIQDYPEKDPNHFSWRGAEPGSAGLFLTAAAGTAAAIVALI